MKLNLNLLKNKNEVFNILIYIYDWMLNKALSNIDTWSCICSHNLFLPNRVKIKDLIHNFIIQVTDV